MSDFDRSRCSNARRGVLRFACASVLFCLLLSSSATALDSYLSVAKFIELERAAVDKAVGSPVVTVYLGGVIEALGFANARLQNDGSNPLFCVPASGVSAEKLRFLIEGQIAQAQGAMSTTDFAKFQNIVNVGAISFDILRKTFPCQSAPARRR